MPPKTVKPRFVKTRAQRLADNATIKQTLRKRRSATPPPPPPPPPEPEAAPVTTTSDPEPEANAASIPLQPPPPPTGLVDERPPPPPPSEAQRPVVQVVAPAGSAPNDDINTDELGPPITAQSLQPMNSASHSNCPITASASTTDSTAGTMVRSIRCKNLVIDPIGGPAKRKRGVVVGMKTKEMVRLTKAKIVVTWDEKHNMLANKKVAAQLSRDIGMKVKDDVPMLASVYGDLHHDFKGIVYTYIAGFYAIDLEYDGQFQWVENVATSRYKDWKHDCRRHWEKYGAHMPLEFLKRLNQWECLVKEFNSEENKELSLKMKRIRRAPSSL